MLEEHFEDQIFAEWTAYGPLVDEFWMQINKWHCCQVSNSLFSMLLDRLVPSKQRL